MQRLRLTLLTAVTVGTIAALAALVSPASAQHVPCNPAVQICS
jgi:hypothetical protein